MIKNIIFDVGMVLVNWDPHAAFQELGFDEKTEEAVGNATVYSDAWNESDRSVLDAEEQLAVFVQNAPEYEKEIRPPDILTNTFGSMIKIRLGPASTSTP